VLGKLVEQGAAQRAGLMTGDRVLRFNERAVQDSRQLREDIRASVKDGQAQAAVWELVRDGQTLSVRVEPDLVREGEQTIARVGAMIGSPVEMTTVRYGLLEGLTMGLERTWEMSVLSLRMMARVLTGQASVKNISGPLTIADYAGRSASVGLMAYLTFMALISVSLGVLNLLPVPVLDGGHLMYYLWEALTGRPVSEVWLERFGRLGLALLALMMGVAVFNDLTRLLG
jgi:regulator of sigma E protease